MSGRRSSRAASSRASSLSREIAALATPRRSTRNKSVTDDIQLDTPPRHQPMVDPPPLAARQSTSYGSALAAAPGSFPSGRGGNHGGNLSEELADILGAVEQNLPPASQAGSRGRGRRGGSKARSGSTVPVGGNAPAASGASAATNAAAGGGEAPPATPKAGANSASYLGESVLFGDADFNADSAGSPPRHRAAKKRTVRVAGATQRESLWVQLSAWIGTFYQFLLSGFGILYSMAQRILSRWDILVLLLALLAVANLFKTKSSEDVFGRNLEPSRFDVIHHVRQWFPSSFSGPLSYSNDLDISDLQGRMSSVENELQLVKHHIALSKDILEELKRILPEDMYLSKANGHAEIPPTFWQALKQKTLQGSKDKFGGVSRSEWDDFLAQNEVKVKAWQAEASEDLWAQHLKDAMKDGGILASKAEIIEMIKDRWTQDEILIKKYMRTEIRNAAKVLTPPKGITKEEVVQIYNELAVKALAQTQDSINVAYYQRERPNHFAIGLGAVVNPSITSPTYAFAKVRAWWPQRLILWSAGFALPTPNPPVEALRKWDEAGDCWCSPAQGSGAGVQLGVLMANDLFPKEVVVEHIPKTATLDPSSAPQRMELIASIAGNKNIGIVGDLSERVFPEHYESVLGREWILIGTWVYDAEAPNHVQHFYPQVDLQTLGVSVRQLVVRAKNNQGTSDHTCLYRVRVYGELAEQYPA